MSTATVAVADLVSAVRRQRLGTTTPAWIANRANGSLTRVRGAHPGVGASTVAVALGDVATARDVATVVDLAVDEGFGASASIDARADLALRGWSGGRRGRVRVVRPVDDVAAAEAIQGHVIVDTPDWVWHVDSDVLVTRATVPSVLRAEGALAARSVDAIAVVGASRWPAAARACFGPRLKAMDAQKRIVFFPSESELEINGLSAEPLPASTARAARRLLELLERDGVAQGTNRRRS
jgi:hypothetical protein